MRRRGRGLNTPGSAFDAFAADYDDVFTTSSIGRVMRDAVWRRLADIFPSGSNVLELNCGTGVDAVWLAARGINVRATDASRAMVDIAVARGVNAVQYDAEQIRSFVDQPAIGAGSFDGALSNFGGLNCVSDLAAVASGTAFAVRADGVVVLCIMGPVVPWEWAWQLGHGKPHAAFRRLRRSTQWRGVTITYPAIRRVRRTFDPWFSVDRVWALGALIPPSYVEPWAQRHPRLLSRLGRIERRVERWPGVAHLADHYVIELRRR